MKYFKSAIYILLIFVVVSCVGKTKQELLKEGVGLRENGNLYGSIVLFKNALEKDQNYFEARFQLADSYLLLGKYDDAEKELKKVRMQDPSFPGLKLKFAELFVSTHRPDKAIDEISHYIIDKGKNAQALNLLGRSYAEKNDLSTAKKLFKSSIELDSDFVAARLNLARVCIQEGKTTTAENLLEEVVQKAPGDKAANAILGRLEASLGHLDKALEVFQHLEKIAPAEPRPIYMEGLLEVSKGDVEQGDQLAQKLIRNFPREGLGYQLKGIVLYKKGGYENAIVQFQKANQIGISLSSLYFLGRSYEHMGKLELALNQYQKILDYKPNSVSARIMVASVLLKQKRLEESQEEIGRALTLDPENGLAHQVLGSIYFSKRFFDKAMDEFSQAIKNNPGLVDAHFEKGILALAGGDIGSGEKELSKAVSLAPNIPGTRLALASYYLHQQNYSAAIKVLEKGLCGKETDALFYNYLAAAYFAQKKTATGIKCLNLAKAAKPDYFAPYYNLGNYYAANGNFKSAFGEYSEVLKKKPQNIKALLLCGMASELLKKNKEALKFYNRAKNTKNVKGYIALANFYRRNKEYNEAIKVIDEFIENNPSNISVLKYKGELLVENKEYKKAIDVYESIEELNPGEQLYEIAKIYIITGNINKAKIRVEKFILNHKQSIKGYLVLSYIYQNTNNQKKALEVLENALREVNDKTDIYIAIAKIYEKNNENNLAIKIYSKILKNNSKDIRALFSLGAIYDQIGNKSKALDRYKEVLDLSGNFTPALNNLAYLYADNYGKTDEALELAMKAFRNEPSNPNVMDTLGYVLVKKGRAGEAVQLLKNAANLLGKNPTVAFHLALAYRALGEKAEAVKVLRNAIKSGNVPASAPSRNLLKKLAG